MPVENPNKEPRFGMIVDIMLYPSEGHVYSYNVVCSAQAKLNNGEFVKMDIVEARGTTIGMRIIFRGVIIGEYEVIGRENMSVPNVIHTDIPTFLRDYSEGILEYIATKVEVRHV